jgi:hypothetical protein
VPDRESPDIGQPCRRPPPLPGIYRDENQDQDDYAHCNEDAHKQLLDRKRRNPISRPGLNFATLVAGDGFEPPTFGL